MSLGFIIPTCCKNNIHLRQLKRCIDSIRKFHNDNYIILINDSLPIYNLMKEFNGDKKIIVKESIKKGSADQQIFKIFMETELFDIGIFIQDSMLLNKKIEKLYDLKFLWHFTNHIIHWDIIQEPKTEYNKNNNITTHNDLIVHCLKKYYQNNKDFLKYALENLKNKNNWCGCFGSLCMISKKELIKLNNKVKFIDIFIEATSNRNRRVNETIFSLICHYCHPVINFKNSYDGLYYDGVKHGGNSSLINKDTGFDNLRWCSVHNYFSKVSFNR